MNCLVTLTVLSVLTITANSEVIGNNSVTNCTCVPFNQCLDEDIKKDGAGLLDVRIFEESSCVGHFDVCCNSTIQDKSVNEKPEKGCGYQNTGFFPWSASLLYKKTKKSNYIHKCGVSLINRRAVITAAHCTSGDDKGIWVIRLGNILRVVKKIIVHPLYEEATLHNDISIIILNSAFPNVKKISTICIPPKGTVIEKNATCSSPTWIQIHNNNKTYSYMTISKLPIVPREKCLKSLRNTRLGSMFQLHHSFICAESEDTCEGNGGSSLVCPIPGQPTRYHQAGIVSWGIGCGANDTPNVFVKVSLFREWIDEELLKHDLDINSYRY